MLRTHLVPLTLVFACVPLALASVRLAPQLAQPSEQHDPLLAGVGAWEGTLKSVYPGMPESTVAASQTVEAVGGFWTQTRFECDFMGMPYVGTGCMGYDSAKKKYVGTWIDSMSTYLALMEGETDPASGAIIMRWKAPDMEGVMNVHRSETVWTDDAYVCTFFMGEGAGTQFMKIEMKRKGAKPTGAK